MIGFTMAEALVELVEPFYQQVAIQFARWNASSEHQRAARSHRIILWGSLSRRIRSGELEVSGIKDGESVPQKIDAHFFAAATPDLNADTLRLGSVIYRAVAIRESPASIQFTDRTAGGSMRPETGSATAARQHTRETIIEWMIDYSRRAIAGGKLPPKRDGDLFPACSAATGASVALMKAAYRELPEELVRARGRPRENRT